MGLSCSQKIINIIKSNCIKNNGDFYCLKIVFIVLEQKKLELDKKVCKNKDFCSVTMPSEDTKILEFN